MTICICGRATVYLISLGLRPKEAFPPSVCRLRGALPRSNFRCSATCLVCVVTIRLSLTWAWHERKTEPSVIINLTFISKSMKSLKLLFIYFAVLFGVAHWCLPPAACCPTPTQTFTIYNCPHWEFWADMPVCVFRRLELDKQEKQTKLKNKGARTTAHSTKTLLIRNAPHLCQSVKGLWRSAVSGQWWKWIQQLNWFAGFIRLVMEKEKQPNGKRCACCPCCVSRQKTKKTIILLKKNGCMTNTTS